MSSIQKVQVFLVALSVGILIRPEARANEAEERPEIRVGIADGDIRGDDHRAIQAAIDYVANLGGGTVRIGPGPYVLRNSITLRDHIQVIGTAGKTVLAPVEGAKTALAADGDANQRAITLADPSGFKVGDRVLISDDHYGSGFDITSAVLIAKVGKATFRLSEPLRNDYMVNRHGRVELSFPAVGGWNIRDAAVEDVTIEGTRGQTPCKAADGCRHGGIYLFECAEVAIRRCAVRNYNGDGISFQVSRGVTVEECVAEKNAGLGLHPGSGSECPVVRHCRATDNGGDGLFVCWRVKNGQFEDNELRGNQGVGISIGHKDSDNLFRGNRVTANKGVGLLFREETEAMGAHRNVFEKNVFLDNGLPAKGEPTACIVIQGHHHDLVFRNNTIGVTSEKAHAAAGIAAGKDALRLEAKDNEFRGVKQAVQVGK
ncbi:MAG TPA: right-handed parallel beta-helix repeat-containing protein [Gemmataceae bacterium]|nr:right-handed parallel beta-helix repeat-containing protein [Gemmataceae bacterium]